MIRVIGTNDSQRDQKAANRVLMSVCGAHGIQDGLVALQFVLFPVLAQAFGLSYTQVGLLKAVHNAAMTVFEIPSGLLAEKVGEKRLLSLGLVAAGLGYFGVASSTSFVALIVFFFIAGAGAAFQHSLSSSLVVQSFEGGARRRALGTYNSSGDAGKLCFTAAFSMLLGAGLAWNLTVVLLATLALILAVALWLFVKARPGAREMSDSPQASGSWGILDPRRFWTLTVITCLDTVVQAVFLTFVAFVLIEKGLSPAIASIAVVLTLAGGMVGKFWCGRLAAGLGDRHAFLLIQVLTIVGLGATVLLPAAALLVLLPFVGVFVQGSSTVCYGSVADLVDDRRQSRGYSLIYTAGSLASVAGPIGLGAVADHAGLATMLWILAGLTAVTLTLAGCLGQRQQSAA